MIIGIEVDNLFNCHLQDASGQPVSGEGPACTIDYVSQQMLKYYAMGVRHIFPSTISITPMEHRPHGQSPLMWAMRIVRSLVGCSQLHRSGLWVIYLDPATDSFLYLFGFGGAERPDITQPSLRAVATTLRA